MRSVAREQSTIFKGQAVDYGYKTFNNSTKIKIKMMNQLNIESNPLDELIGINLESQSEIDLTYLEQFASNTFSQLTHQLIASSSEDSVTVYEDKSEYRAEVENGPISNLLEPVYNKLETESIYNAASPTSQSMSPTSYISPRGQYLSPTSDYSSPTCHLPSPPPLTPSPTLDPSIYQTPNQVFFPVGFNPNHFQYQPACNQPHQQQQNQYPQEWSPTDCNSFQLQAAPKVRRSRASRSRCPCLKCCSARVNGLPSPSQHLCIIKGCQKSYSRPAHLRNHLKTHQNQSDLKCEICLRKFVTSEMIISHMSDEHEADLKLF